MIGVCAKGFVESIQHAASMESKIYYNFPFWKVLYDKCDVFCGEYFSKRCLNDMLQNWLIDCLYDKYDDLFLTKQCLTSITADIIHMSGE